MVLRLVILTVRVKFSGCSQNVVATPDFGHKRATSNTFGPLQDQLWRDIFLAADGAEVLAYTFTEHPLRGFSPVSQPQQLSRT